LKALDNRKEEDVELKTKVNNLDIYSKDDSEDEIKDDDIEMAVIESEK